LGELIEEGAALWVKGYRDDTDALRASIAQAAEKAQAKYHQVRPMTTAGGMTPGMTNIQGTFGEHSGKPVTPLSLAT
jgi:hypothetical protein